MELYVQRTAEGDELTWYGARDRSDGPYLLYNIYASKEEPVDINNPANLVATRHLWQQLTIERKAGKPRLHYAVTALDRYGNESVACYEHESNVQQPGASASVLLPNDGKALKLEVTTDAEYLAVCTLQGSIIHTCHNRPTVDLRPLPNGIYVLRSLNRKGIMHRLGFFIVKR